MNFEGNPITEIPASLNFPHQMAYTTGEAMVDLIC
jgi:hypothetical protein